MHYGTEIPMTEDDLDGQMNRMRAWLDHQRSEPSSFRLQKVGPKQVVRVLFRTEREAGLFAAEFGGSSDCALVRAAAIA